MSDSAAGYWAQALDGWRIPDDILAKAPVSPWIHPVELFATGDGEVPDSPSHMRARQALPATGGSVLDVGCGGGRAAFALVPPASFVTGVDSQQGMLEEFAAAAGRRGVGHAEILGTWPEVRAQAPVADVVVCHHVAYNVAPLASFAAALDRHARHRVVLELPQRHPLAHMAPLWRHFWGLERPDGPTAQDAAAVLTQAGLPARLELWTDDQPHRMAALPWDKQVAFMRTRLCLPADRDAEVGQVLQRLDDGPRSMATIWWDAAGSDDRRPVAST